MRQTGGVREASNGAAAARGGVLRPRQDPDGGLLGHLLRPRGLRDGHDLAPAAGARRVREPALSPARLDRRSRRRRAPARRRDDRRRARARPRAPLAARARGRAAAPVPADARARLRPPGRGRAGVHPDRRLAGDGRPAGARARLRRRPGLALGDRRRPLHGPAGRAVQLPRGQGAVDARAAPSARRSTSDASYAYSDSESDLPMLRAVRPRRSSSTPTPDAAADRREEGWEVCSSTASAGA